MPILTPTVDVGDTPILLVSSAGATAGIPVSAVVTNPSTNTVSIWAGGPAVAASGATVGHEIPPGESFEIDLGPGDDLYGIAAVAGPTTVRTFKTRQ